MNCFIYLCRQMMMVMMWLLLPFDGHHESRMQKARRDHIQSLGFFNFSCAAAFLVFIVEQS